MNFGQIRIKSNRPVQVSLGVFLGNGSMGRGGGAVRGASGGRTVPQLASGEAAGRPKLPVPSPPL